jgi:predicted enzyme related to lactoylglutathione lyase
MTASLPSPVVHLELHTGDLARARALYAKLCGWRAEQIEIVNGSYLALEPGNNLGGGIVECGTRRAVWLPYVEAARHGDDEGAFSQLVASHRPALEL